MFSIFFFTRSSFLRQIPLACNISYSYLSIFYISSSSSCFKIFISYRHRSITYRYFSSQNRIYMNPTHYCCAKSYCQNFTFFACHRYHLSRCYLKARAFKYFYSVSHRGMLPRCHIPQKVCRFNFADFAEIKRPLSLC